MSYAEAKARYAAIGVDTEAAIARLKTVPISLHCWQGDDVRGFDTDPTKPLTGGIQTTGNYPGRARTPEELMADMDKVLSFCPGTKKINLHASYAIFDEENPWVDRDKLEPKHFKKWVDFCKARGLGADFNPTFFSHPKCDPLTLASPNEETRKFWVEHGKACIRISQYLAEELGQPCTMNIWTGDGFKDIPADRKGPGTATRQALTEYLSEPYDFKLVKPCIESKVFGIGVEAYTVGSAEFALSYAAFNREKCIPLMDNGHYHPTEVVSDKILPCWPSSRRSRSTSPAPSAGTPTTWCCSTMKRRRSARRSSAAAVWMVGQTLHWTTLMPPSTAFPHGRWASATWKRRCCLPCAPPTRR